MNFRFLALCSFIALAGRSAEAQSRSVPKVSRYGDVVISAYDRVRGKTDLSGLRITGAKTLIVVPDKASGSELRIHADDIQTQSEGQDTFAVTELTGHVRYTLLQKTQAGTRILDGTSRRATLRRKAQKIELQAGVEATLSDPERLALPGTLKAGRVLADLSQTPTLYLLSGSAEENDLRFRPKERSGAANAKTELQETHLHHFRQGTFQVGQRAQFEGENTTADFLNPLGEAASQLKASSIRALFTAEKSRLKGAAASGDVRFRFSRPADKDRPAENLTGSADEAAYDFLNERPRYVLKGSVNATLVSPKQVQGPARLEADRIEVTQALLQGLDIFHYHVTARPGRGSLRFTPVPAPAAAAEKPKSVFQFGTITLKGVEDGTLETGKSFVLTGSRLTFESDDPASGSKAKLSAQKVVGIYSAEAKEAGVLKSASASGNAAFSILQPAVREIAGRVKPRAAQTLEGKAQRIVYTNGGEERVVALEGPLDARLTDPDNLVKPGVITGKTGDVLKLILLENGYDFDVETANQTATIQFEPRIKPKPEAAEGKPRAAPSKAPLSTPPGKKRP